jgi:hypothetical protein
MEALTPGAALPELPLAGVPTGNVQTGTLPVFDTLPAVPVLSDALNSAGAGATTGKHRAPTVQPTGRHALRESVGRHAAPESALDMPTGTNVPVVGRANVNPTALSSLPVLGELLSQPPSAGNPLF